jgi:hypothetical protein
METIASSRNTQLNEMEQERYDIQYFYRDMGCGYVSTINGYISKQHICRNVIIDGYKNGRSRKSVLKDAKKMLENLYNKDKRCDDFTDKDKWDWVNAIQTLIFIQATDKEIGYEIYLTRTGITTNICVFHCVGL